jgi:hypothetical protein
MIIRPYRPEDRETLRRIHAGQGFGYEFPDIDHPLFVLKGVAEEAGQVRMAGMLRLTAEAYLLVDPRAGSAPERWETLVELHEAMRRGARARGLEDAFAVIPPQIERAFGRRLRELGWVRGEWSRWVRAT